MLMEFYPISVSVSVPLFRKNIYFVSVLYTSSYYICFYFKL